MKKVFGEGLLPSPDPLDNTRMKIGLSRQEKEPNLDHPSPASRFAAIDVGSHTLRMLIATVGKRHEVLPLRRDRRITRLARDFSQTENLSEPSMVESLAVLAEFSALLRQHQVTSVICGATGVVRRAGNAGEFLQRIEKMNGPVPSIISEEREAYLSAKGVLCGLPRKEGVVLSFDLGGSSTEFMLIDCNRELSLWNSSVFIGAATATERFLPGDPPTASVGIRAREAVRSALHPQLAQLQTVLQYLHLPLSALQVVGTAGSVTTLAAMFLEMRVYDPFRINGVLLSHTWLNLTIDLLARTPLRERRQLAGLEAGREGIILGGALIVAELLRGLKQEQFMVVDSGLLEGLLLTLIEQTFGLPERLVSPFTMDHGGEQ